MPPPYNVPPGAGCLEPKELLLATPLVGAPRIPNTGAAMSNPNGLLGQKLCRYLNQGRILKDILMRAAH